MEGKKVRKGEGEGRDCNIITCMELFSQPAAYLSMCKVC